MTLVAGGNAIDILERLCLAAASCQPAQDVEFGGEGK